MKLITEIIISITIAATVGIIGGLLLKKWFYPLIDALTITLK